MWKNEFLKFLHNINKYLEPDSKFWDTLPSGRVLRFSCKNLVMIDGLLNENSELKK